MILQLKNVEAAAITLHMAMMRKSFRNLLKKQYKQQKDDYLTAYDYVLNESKYQLEEKLEIYNLHLNIVDLEVLTSFLEVYIDKSEKELKKALTGEYREHLNILKNIQNRCSEMLQDVC